MQKVGWMEAFNARVQFHYKNIYIKEIILLDSDYGREIK